MSSFIIKAISFRKAPSLIWSVSCQGIRMEAEETRLHRESGGQRMEILWVDLTKNRFYDKKCYVFVILQVGKMLKILVLEDEDAHLKKLKNYLERFHLDNPSFEYSLKSYDRGIMLLTDYKRDTDLVFLDIRVSDMLGIDVAGKLREMDEDVMIIFVTSLTQYAVDGYSVRAFDYILKPLRYSSFSAKMKLVLKSLSARQPGRMLDIRNREGGRKISTDNITYIESRAHDIYIHMGDETIRQWGTLGKLEDTLRDVHFARCSTSFLVNLKYVQGVKKDEVIVDGQALPISRTKRKDFLAALAAYEGERM